MVAIVIAAFSTALGVLPVFLLGGLSVFMGPELGFDERGLGFSVGLFFLVSALLATTAGRIGDRLGPRSALRLGVAASFVSLVGIGWATRTWVHLLALLAVGAVGCALSQTAGNILLMGAVPEGRRAVGFAIKQSAVPFANLLGGAAVPVLGLTLGWRYAFVFSALLAVVLAVPLPAVKARPAGAVGPVARWPLFVLALGAAGGSGAGNAAITFLVPWATTSGIAPGTAGSLLAFGGAMGMAARVLAGVACDRYRLDGLKFAATLVGCASFGYATLATGPRGTLLVGAVAVVFGAGVGWSGLLTFAVAQSHPDAAGRATGMSQAGIFAGGIYAPPLFGLIVLWAGYEAAWLFTAGLSLAGATLFTVGRVMLARAVQARPAAGAPPA